MIASSIPLELSVVKTRAAVLVAWVRAMRGHACTLDDAAAEIMAGDEHVAFERMGPDGEHPVLRDVLLELVAQTGPIELALPVPGDVRGLPGAGSWTAPALDAGEAVVTHASVLVPVVEAFGNDIEGYTTVTRWQIHDRSAVMAQPRPHAGIAEADRELRAALTTAVDHLAGVDVARWSPELAEAVADIRTLRRSGDPFASGLPRSYGPQARELIARAGVVERIIDAANSAATTLLDSVNGIERARALNGLAASVRESICAGINEGDSEWRAPGAGATITDQAQANQ